jgi:hypothetical protein
LTIYNWFNEQIAKLNLTWETIKGLFKRAWDSLGPGDILNPGGAFEKIKNVFGEPINRIKNFAINAGTKVMEFVFEGVMGGGGAKVMEIIRSAGGVFNTIISDPIKFVGNLVGAVKGGFQQFSGNILTHLKNGLVGWLFGALAGAGLALPAQFDLKGIVSLVLQVLGLTYQRMRGMLVKLIGEPKVVKLEKAFDFLMMIVTQGLGAAWQKITEFVGGLQEMVMGGIREWVQNSIITAAITKLLSMFNPAGAVIQAVMAIYNTVMFFIERGSQIAALGEAVFASIGTIAAGNIAGAATYVEQTMGRTLPVMISFLARLIGLGGISEQIKNVIKKIQAPIETAMTKVANFVVEKGKSLLGKGKDDKDNKEKGEKEHEALAKQAVSELQQTNGEAKDYKTLRAEKEAQAKQIEQSYTPKLEQGIKLTVHFNDAAKDEQDSDLDFKVVIAPNDTVVPGSIKVDDNLKAAVNSKGILSFMRAVAAGETVMGIDRNELEKLWKKQDNKDWLKDKFRSANSGKHEWIPTNMIMSVINRTAGVEDGVEVADWIELQHQLRTDTSWVIFKPSRGKTEDYQGKNYTVLQGHVGALYLNGEQKTSGTQAFHNMLRQSFSASKTINQCLTDLQKVFEEWVWNGQENPNPPIHPLLQWNGTRLAENLTSAKSQQAANFQATQSIFENLKKK